MTAPIPLLVPAMPAADELLPWLRRIDETRWYTNFGPLNAELERALAEVLDREGELHVTSVANCTLGLELALSELGLAPGSRVLLPAITFVATATAVRRAGLVPLLGEVDDACWLLTPALAREALRTRDFAAVMPVATFGHGQDADAWDDFHDETGIPVVIDAASALGNQRIGRHSTAVFSLHATKSLGAGEGGLIASRDRDQVHRLRRATNFGIDLESMVADTHAGGTNAKLSEYHAAVGLAALARWHEQIATRSALRAAYREALGERLGNRVLLQEADDQRVHTTMVVRIPGCPDVQAVLGRLAGHGIGARRWYCPPLHRHTAFRDCPTVDGLATAERLGGELLGLPFYPGLGDGSVRRVADALADALGAAG